MTDLESNDTHDDEIVHVSLPRGDVKLMRKMIEEKRAENYTKATIKKYGNTIRFIAATIISFGTIYATWDWLLHAVKKLSL